MYKLFRVLKTRAKVKHPLIIIDIRLSPGVKSVAVNGSVYFGWIPGKFFLTGSGNGAFLKHTHTCKNRQAKCVHA